MPDIPAAVEGFPGPTGPPVIFAGRFAGRVTALDLPSGCVVVADHDAPVLPDDPSVLVFLDLLPSSPLEAPTDYPNAPIVVALPPDSSAESLDAAFGTLFERLGFFDRIVTPDLTLWARLRRKYRWAEGQRIPAAGEDPGEVVAAVRTLLETDASLSKASHRARAAALAPWLAAPLRGERGGPRDVLQVGAGVGRWVPGFDPAETRFVGIDVRADLISTARANFPEHRFDLATPGPRFPYDDESFDLVFSEAFMHRHPEPAKRTLLSEMWRVARSGGRLLFLEDFVFERREPDIHPMSVSGFQSLVLDATAWRVALEHVESLRYPAEDQRRGGLISLWRLGFARP